MGTQIERTPVQSVVHVGISLTVGIALTAVLFVVVPERDIPDATVHPAVVTGACLAGQLLYLSYSLDASVLVQSPRSAVFGIANAVTLLRGALYAVVAGFVVVPAEAAIAWVPAACYGVGVVLDQLDGTIARTVGQETTLGTRLDQAFDTFGFVVAPLVAVLWGALPVYYLALSGARYAFVGAVWLRRWRGGTVYSLPDSDLGRYLAGLQMVFITVALVPTAPTAYVHSVAPLALAPSIAVFVRDYYHVTGRLGTTH
ncbi:CDP-diacylglycerol--glycerol-3-phosphate 3-phosphatidyltransferase [Halovenus aranensis]|uniref:CDP-diacylglycerol--glycerol-3-phosphate 3-phosphatidyltransferase n=1 Tax=Halovenus aranensis TaxID=890420 RepID=A0A1G8S6S9_9EURY|nr:CDP-alcohol phosphatidyltransferase family protein [Halovenus aranensis]SDJ24380.1 CDP-diacylglycerol--glycerol-3-phosphate 3-phosphatidyltransferase [Halovenus aranensis]